MIPSGSQQRGITDRHSPSCLQASGSLSLDRRLDVAGSRGFHCARRTVAASISAAGYAGLNLSQRPSISGRRKRLRPGECLSPRLLRSMATLEGACWPGTTPRHLPQILRWPGGAALTGERHTVVSHSFIESGQHLACPSLRGAPCCHVHAFVSPLERLRQKARARLFASRPLPVRPLPPAIRGRRGLARSLPTSTTFQSRRKNPAQRLELARRHQEPKRSSQIDANARVARGQPHRRRRPSCPILPQLSSRSCTCAQRD